MKILTSAICCLLLTGAVLVSAQSEAQPEDQYEQFREFSGIEGEQRTYSEDDDLQSDGSSPLGLVKDEAGIEGRQYGGGYGHHGHHESFVKQYVQPKRKRLRKLLRGKKRNTRYFITHQDHQGYGHGHGHGGHGGHGHGGYGHGHGGHGHGGHGHGGHGHGGYGHHGPHKKHQVVEVTRFRGGKKSHVGSIGGGYYRELDGDDGKLHEGDFGDFVKQHEHLSSY